MDAEVIYMIVFFKETFGHFLKFWINPVPCGVKPQHIRRYLEYISNIKKYQNYFYTKLKIIQGRIYEG